MKKPSPNALLSCSAFLISTSVYMVNPIFPVYIREHLGASLTEVGLLVSAAFIASFIVKLPMGMALAGRRLYNMTVGSVAIIAVVPATYALAPNIPTLLFLRIVHGIGWALVWVLLWTEASNVEKGDKMMTSVATFAIISSLGVVAGPTLSTVLTALLGSSTALTVSSFAAAPALVLVLMLPKDLHHPEEGGNTDTAKWRVALDMLSHPGVHMPMLGVSAFSFAYGVMLSYAPVYAYERFMLSESVTASLFMGYSGMAMATRLVLGRMLRIFSLATILALALLNSATMMAAMSLSGELWPFAIAFSLMGISQGLIIPINSLIVARNAAPSNRVLANALTLSGLDLGVLLGPLAASALIPYFGIAPVIGLLGLIPLLSAVPIKISSKKMH